jgi:uncharacterized protein YjbI with pentapeptide repeats
MVVLIPAPAIMRPRVRVAGSAEPRLLEEAIAELADEQGCGIVRLTGRRGSGKSTALAHLAAIFSGDPRFRFLDEPTDKELDDAPGGGIRVVATPWYGGRDLELALQPWGIDELIEYLLATHYPCCGLVIERLGVAARQSWLPRIATIVLDRFAADISLGSPSEALMQHLDEQWTAPKQRQAAAQFSLAALAGGAARIVSATAELKRSEIPDRCRDLIALEMVQLSLAAERLQGMISRGDFSELGSQLPQTLVRLVGELCRPVPRAIRKLQKALQRKRHEAVHAMAASILLAADPAWRLPRRRRPWSLPNGFFPHAQWLGESLVGAGLWGCDFADADLDTVVFDNARLVNTCFDRARLTRASFQRASACYARFAGAVLQHANFDNADLTNADFSQASLESAIFTSAILTGAHLRSASLQQADLSGARLRGVSFDDCNLAGAVLCSARLGRADLRRALLDGACLSDADLKWVQLEGVHATGLQLQNVVLVGALLSGTRFPVADLRGANLKGARLAEIHWEEADLRGANLDAATFHMGSSRSGLVGSPYACEGSKTGFYADDFEELSFRHPEEVRKANLCRADLRGVSAAGVDFYLVDLRGAKLDPHLCQQARATGAILSP